MSKALDCPKCGAPLHLTPGSAVLHCQFCATDVAAPTAIRPAPPPQAPQIPRIAVVQRPMPTARATVSPLRLLAPLFSLFIFAVIGGATFFRSMRGVGFGPKIVAGISQIQQPRWLQNGPTILVADVDQDGDEDVIGMVAEYAKGANEQYLAAYDVSTQKPIWTSVHVAESWTARMAISGKRILLVEGTGKGHLIDASTGKETASVTLTDKMSRSCVDDGRFVLSLDDKTVVSVDGKSAVVSPTTWPASCGPTQRSNIHSIIGSFEPRAKERNGYDAGVTLKGAYVGHLLDDGKIFAGFATKSPGTARPIVFAADRKTKAIVWSHALLAGDVEVRDGSPEVADLVDGTLLAVVSSRVSSPTREYLVAIDAASGDERWHSEIDSKTPGMGATALIVGDDRVYVPRSDQVQIFARKDGRRVAILGPQQ